MADGYFRFTFSTEAKVEVNVLQPFGREFTMKSLPDFRNIMVSSQLAEQSPAILSAVARDCKTTR